jgi:hypothetical protein
MIKYFSIVFIVLFLFTGCSKKTILPTVPFELTFNQQGILSADGTDLTVQFTQLVEESRCPPNVQCIWAGQVAVKLKINNSEQFIVGLNHSNYPSSFSYMNHEYTLLDVTYTNEASFGIENKCVVKLKVE